MKYNRLLLKLSGESLGGDSGGGIQPQTLDAFAEDIANVHGAGVEIAVVIGGGNIFRGVAGAVKGMDRTTADYMGMMATVINSLAMQDALERRGVFTRVQSAIEMHAVAEPYIRRRAIRHLEKKRVVIFAAGIGNPYFSTDTAAALRAMEVDADVVVKGTKVNGIYDKDPLKYPDAKMYKELTYLDILQKGLKVMDATAISLCMDNQLPIIVTNIAERTNLREIAEGKPIGTLVWKGAKS